MSYEEKFIDGKLMFRYTTKDAWFEKPNYYGVVARLVYDLTDLERENLFTLFCTHCGSTDTRCQCWNDE